MDKPWKVILTFIGVFAAGAIFGGVFTIGVGKKFRAEVARVVKPPPTKATRTQPQQRKAGEGATPTSAARGIQPAIMRQLTHRLNPTPDQKRAILPIVGRATEDIQRLSREHITDITRVTERMYQDVSAVLSPEQRVQLEKMRQETLARARQERQKRMGPVEPPKEGANLPGALPRKSSASTPK